MYNLLTALYKKGFKSEDVILLRKLYDSKRNIVYPTWVRAMEEDIRSFGKK